MASCFVDMLGDTVRLIVRTAMGMPANSVRPANQQAPTGAAAGEFATVLLTEGQTTRRGTPTIQKTDIQSTDLQWNIDVLREFTASVQFFRAGAASGATVDSLGLPVQSDGAFDKACRLPDRMWLPPVRDLLNYYGLAYEGEVGSAKNIPAELGGHWESRGQVMLAFAVVSRESLRIAYLASLNCKLVVAQPGGTVDTKTFEVTT